MKIEEKKKEKEKYIIEKKSLIVLSPNSKF